MQSTEVVNQIQTGLQNGYQYLQQGVFDQAQVAFRGVLKLQPKHAQATYLLGLSYLQAGELDRAVNFLNKARKIDANNVELLNNLGMAYRKQKKIDKAIDCFEQCLKLDPSLSAARLNLAISLKESGDISKALELVKIEVTNAPNNKQILFTFGNMLVEAEEFELAIEQFQKAIEIDSNYIEGLVNQGNIYKLLGRFDEALACYDRVLALHPSHDAVKVNKGMILLARGQFKEGWALYEKRIKIVDFEESSLKKINSPKWTGESLEGKRVLVHTEQGFGDTLQFCRYITWLKSLGCEIVLYIDKKLKDLLSTLDGVDELILYGESIPKHDYRVSVMSLPYLYYRTGGDFQFQIPYLSVKPSLVDLWDKKIGPKDKKRVGVVWQGNPGFMWDKFRSIALENYLPVLESEAVDIIGLQVFDPKNQLNKLYKKQPQLKNKINDVGKLIREGGASFEDTAAIFSCLDVLITSDTSVAHLAGALGLPVWLVAGVVPDFRWGMTEETIPDYPSMRVFRQTDRYDWLSVFEKISGQLARL